MTMLEGGCGLDGQAELLRRRRTPLVAHRPPGRGGGGRLGAGRATRDDAAHRSAPSAGASHLRLALRRLTSLRILQSRMLARRRGEGTRGAQNTIGVQAIFAER